MARERPTASNDQANLACLDGDRPDIDGQLLTRAEAHALCRCAPLAHVQLKEHLKPVSADRPRAL